MSAIHRFWRRTSQNAFRSAYAAVLAFCLGVATAWDRGPSTRPCAEVLADIHAVLADAGFEDVEVTVTTDETMTERHIVLVDDQTVTRRSAAEWHARDREYRRAVERVRAIDGVASAEGCTLSMEVCGAASPPRCGPVPSRERSAKTEPGRRRRR